MDRQRRKDLIRTMMRLIGAGLARAGGQAPLLAEGGQDLVEVGERLLHAVGVVEDYAGGPQAGDGEAAAVLGPETAPVRAWSA